MLEARGVNDVFDLDNFGRRASNNEWIIPYISLGKIFKLITHRVVCFGMSDNTFALSSFNPSFGCGMCEADEVVGIYIKEFDYISGAMQRDQQYYKIHHEPRGGHFRSREQYLNMLFEYIDNCAKNKIRLMRMKDIILKYKLYQSSGRCLG
jgi:hypothetical protein